MSENSVETDAKFADAKGKEHDWKSELRVKLASMKHADGKQPPRIPRGEKPIKGYLPILREFARRVISLAELSINLAETCHAGFNSIYSKGYVMRILKLAAIFIAMFICDRAQAGVFTGSSGNLSASVQFTAVGSDLEVVLTNTSINAVEVPANVLTAVFFNGGGLLTPTSATVLSGNSIFDGVSTSVSNLNVGGEWAYASSVVGFSHGISSTGLGIFGAGGFNGPDLDSPNAVNGLNYGIVSAGGVASTANNGVTKEPLIQNSVKFILANSNLDVASITSVRFQYGTNLIEPSIIVNGGQIPTVVPEPASCLICLVLGASGIFYRRLRVSR